MTDAIARLGIVVDTRDLERGERELRGFRNGTRGVVDDVNQAETAIGRLNGGFSRVQALALGAGAAIAAAFSVRAIIGYADAWVQIENSLGVVSDSLEDVRAAQEGVFEIANRTRSAFGDTASLFAGLRINAGEILGSTEATLELVETISQAGAVGGASSEEFGNAIRQLNQGLAGGILRAEEFNAVLEQTPFLARQIAEGLDVSIGGLRQLVLDGELSADRVVTALQRQADTIGETFDALAPTVEQSLTVLNNSVGRLIGENVTGLTGALAESILALASGLNVLPAIFEQVAVAATAFFTILAVGNITTIATALSGALVTALQATGVAFLNLTAILNANPLFLVAGLLTAAAVAAFNFVGGLEGIQSALAGTSGAIQRQAEEIDAFLESTSGFAREAADAANEATPAFGELGEAVSGVLDALNDDPLAEFLGQIQEANRLLAEARQLQEQAERESVINNTFNPNSFLGVPVAGIGDTGEDLRQATSNVVRLEARRDQILDSGQAGQLTDNLSQAIAEGFETGDVLGAIQGFNDRLGEFTTETVSAAAVDISALTDEVNQTIERTTQINNAFEISERDAAVLETQLDLIDSYTDELDELGPAARAAFTEFAAGAAESIIAQEELVDGITDAREAYREATEAINAFNLDASRQEELTLSFGVSVEGAELLQRQFDIIDEVGEDALIRLAAAAGEAGLSYEEYARQLAQGQLANEAFIASAEATAQATAGLNEAFANLEREADVLSRLGRIDDPLLLQTELQLVRQYGDELSAIAQSRGQSVDELIQQFAELQSIVDQGQNSLNQQINASTNQGASATAQVFNDLEDLTQQSVGRFWDDFLENGADAINRLDDIFRDFFTDLSRRVLDDIFNPVLNQISSSITGALQTQVGGLFPAGTGGNVTVITGAAASAFSAPTGTSGVTSSSLGSINTTASAASTAGFQNAITSSVSQGFSNINFGSLVSGIQGATPLLAATGILQSGFGGSSLTAALGGFGVLTGGPNLQGFGQIGASIGGGIGSLFGGGGSSGFSTGSILGSGIGGTIGAGVGGAIQGNSVAGLFGLGGGTGGAIGGGVGGIAGQSIGTALGGPVGGAIGSLLGSTLGSIFGGLFGDQDFPFALSQQIVGADGRFAIGGEQLVLDDGDITEAQTLSNAAGTVLNDFADALGGSFSGGGFQVGFASGRGGSELGEGFFAGRGGGFEDGTTFTNLETADEAVRLAIQFALEEIVVEGIDPATQAFIRASASAGTAVEELADNAVFIQGILSGGETRSEFEEARDRINQAFEPLLENAAQLVETTQPLANTDLSGISEALAGFGEFALEDFDLSAISEAFEGLETGATSAAEATTQLVEATSDIEQAFQATLAALQDQFSEGITRQIAESEAPLATAFDDLIETQAQRFVDAEAVGLEDFDDIIRLNSIELEAFLEQAANSPDAFGGFADSLTALTQRAIALGQDVNLVTDAFEQARVSIVSAFDEDIEDQLTQLTNPTLAALETLLEGQAARLAQAQDIGANVVAVERLNALEQSTFFEALSDEQSSQLADFLGLVEDFTGRSGLVLGQLVTSLDEQVSGLSDSFREREAEAQTFQSISDNVLSTRDNILAQFSTASPVEQIDTLRERIVELGRDALDGDTAAAQQLPQVANQLIDLSRSVFGSTLPFQQDLGFVTQTLQDVGIDAQSQADEAFAELEILQSQSDTLIEIRDILNQTDPQLDELTAALDVLAGTEVGDLLEEYLRLIDADSQSVLDLEALTLAAVAAVSDRIDTPDPITESQFSILDDIQGFVSSIQATQNLVADNDVSSLLEPVDVQQTINDIQSSENLGLPAPANDEIFSLPVSNAVAQPIAQDPQQDDQASNNEQILADLLDVNLEGFSQSVDSTSELSAQIQDLTTEMRRVGTLLLNSAAA